MTTGIAFAELWMGRILCMHLDLTVQERVCRKQTAQKECGDGHTQILQFQPGDKVE